MNLNQAPVAQRLSTFIPMKFAKRSGRKVVIRPDADQENTHARAALPNTALLSSLARAFHWQRLLDEGIVKSGAEIAAREELDASTVNEFLRMTLLDPYIVDDIMAGRQPEGLSAVWFTRNSLPCEWLEQQLRIQAIDVR